MNASFGGPAGARHADDDGSDPPNEACILHGGAFVLWNNLADCRTQDTDRENSCSSRNSRRDRRRHELPHYIFCKKLGKKTDHPERGQEDNDGDKDRHLADVQPTQRSARWSVGLARMSEGTIEPMRQACPDQQG